MSDGNQPRPPFEWDENKRRANVLKHGIDFGDSVHVFADPRHRVFGSNAQYREMRFVAVGTVADRVIAVVYTERAGAVRIISARTARRSERALYEQD